jgi:hypothetical protein
MISENQIDTILFIFMLVGNGLVLLYLNRNHKHMFPSDKWQKVIFNILLFLIGAGIAITLLSELSIYLR